MKYSKEKTKYRKMCVSLSKFVDKFCIKNYITMANKHILNSKLRLNKGVQIYYKQKECYVMTE